MHACMHAFTYIYIQKKLFIYLHVQFIYVHAYTKKSGAHTGVSMSSSHVCCLIYVHLCCVIYMHSFTYIYIQKKLFIYLHVQFIYVHAYTKKSGAHTWSVNVLQSRLLSDIYTFMLCNIHTCMHTYAYIHIHTDTYIYIHIQKKMICIHTHTYTYIHIHTYTKGIDLYT